MGETENFGDLLQESWENFKVPQRGSVLWGTIVKADGHGILVDVGGKSEALVDRREMPRGMEVSVGEKVPVLVLDVEDEQGQLTGSLKKARVETLWQQLSQAQESQEVLEVEVRDLIKGGLAVSFQGLKGFMPFRQIGRQYGEDAKELTGKKALVKVMEANRKRNRLVVSARAVEDEEKVRERRELFAQLSLGDDVSGAVTAITNYGAFVSFGHLDGLIHISELSWERIESVKEMLTAGD